MGLAAQFVIKKTQIGWWADSDQSVCVSKLHYRYHLRSNGKCDSKWGKFIIESGLKQSNYIWVMTHYNWAIN